MIASKMRIMGKIVAELGMMWSPRGDYFTRDEIQAIIFGVFLSTKRGIVFFIEPQEKKMHMHCPLKIDNNQGLIFSSSITPISGTVNMETKLGSYEILVSDKNSNEILRKSFRSDALETPFTWDLKSELDSIVESGCYTISLIGASKEIECSIECKVADTRKILSITRSLKHSSFAPDIQALSSIYFDIIEDIQATILERLKDSRFEEPYFVACITAGFIQEIADDIKKHPSRILALMNEFQSKNPMPIKTELGLRALFDFLINYMADTEDHLRANAMAKCGQCHLTQNDRAQIVSSLVSAIYPHCKTIAFPKNIIGGIAEKIVGGIIRLGIRYMSAKHVNRSISICQTLPLQNPCDAVIL